MSNDVIASSDIRAMLEMADLVAVRHVALRMPIAHQIRGFATTALHLSDLLGRCIAGDAEAIARAREIVGAKS